MRDRRLLGLDLLHQFSESGLLGVQLIVKIGEQHFEPFRLRFTGAGAGGTLVQLALELIERLRLGVEPLRQIAVFHRAEVDTQLLEAIAVFLEALGLGCLELDGAELLFYFLNDVLDAGQVLIDPFQLSQRLDLLGLESTDAGGLFEDGAAVLVRGLQKNIDLALGDDAQVVVAGTGAEEEVLDVFEPADLAVDEVFTFAGAVDAAGDLDFRGFRRQLTLAVVERHGDFGQPEAAT